MSAALPFELTTTRQAGSLARLNILVHGPSGAGKTYLAKTTGCHERTLVLAAEPGLLTLRDVDIPVVEVTSLGQLHAVYTWLRYEGLAYDWLIVDSISEVAEKCLAEEMSKPGSGGKKRHGLEAYGEMAERMQRTIRVLLGLPLHVVMLAKQERLQDAGGRLVYGPSMPGKKLTQGLAYLFDEVLALRAEPGEPGEDGRPSVNRFLQAAHDGVYDAKDQSGALAFYEPPNLQHIAEVILGGNEEPTE